MTARKAAPLVPQAPTVGDFSLFTSRTNLGIVTIVVLVLLRIGIGWHFFKEGTNKLKDGDFTAIPVVRQAKGPLAPFFKRHAPDDDAMLAFVFEQYDPETGRIDADEAAMQPSHDWWMYRQEVGDYYHFGDRELQQRLKNERVDVRRSLLAARESRDAARNRIDTKRKLAAKPADQLTADEKANFAAVANSYADDVATYESQSAAAAELEARYDALEDLVLHIRYQHEMADEVVRRWEQALIAYVEANQADFDEYFKSVARRDRDRAEAARQQVDSLKTQLDTIEADVKKKRAPLLAGLNDIWANVDRDLVSLATDQQRESAGLPPEIPKPTDVSPNLKVFNAVLPWFDTIVGGLLILGLFTRLAALAAAFFLVTVIAMQLPWVPDAAPTYYQTVELLALLVLAAVGAGRFAGLDFFLRCLFFKIYRPRRTPVREAVVVESTTVVTPELTAGPEPFEDSLRYEDTNGEDTNGDDANVEEVEEPVTTGTQR